MVMGPPRLPRSAERVFWGLVGQGVSTEAAAAGAGVSWTQGRAWFTQAGGMTPVSVVDPGGRYLSLREREDIAIWRGRLSMREIARRLGRAPSTISRELRRHAPAGRPDRYRASSAQSQAEHTARRPKPRKLAVCAGLHAEIERRLAARCSPEQIAARLRVDFPADPEMRVSHETIYRALYVQGRGALRRELVACLRTGRALRRPRRRTRQPGSAIPAKVMISQRPAEAADRAVPGHWEGDLILGARNGSAIGTLVERSTRFLLLLHLPERHGADAVHDAMLPAIHALPTALRRSLTWDQGTEMARHTDITLATDLPIYFCDPASPWQRGSNENTNGLLRQYFPKGSDLSRYTREDLDHVAAELNTRPRKTLDWHTPAEALAALLSQPDQQHGVATTP